MNRRLVLLTLLAAASPNSLAAQLRADSDTTRLARATADALVAILKNEAAATSYPTVQCIRVLVRERSPFDSALTSRLAEHADSTFLVSANGAALAVTVQSVVRASSADAVTLLLRYIDSTRLVLRRVAVVRSYGFEAARFGGDIPVDSMTVPALQTPVRCSADARPGVQPNTALQLSGAQLATIVGSLGSNAPLRNERWSMFSTAPAAERQVR